MKAIFLIIGMIFLSSAIASPWINPVRGFNANPFVSEEDLVHLSKSGVSVLRLSFGSMPIMDKTPPYNINIAALERLDALIDICARLKIGVVIDPHNGPGMSKQFTSDPDDDIWTNNELQDMWVKMWSFLAKRYVDKSGAIVGYDIFNEPNLRFVDDKSNKWIVFAKKIIKAIREFDSKTPIILETPTGRSSSGWVNRIQGVDYLGDLLKESNIVISPHVYVPHAFTHQGVGRWPNGIKYPGIIDGRQWSKNELEKELMPLIEFSRKNDIPLFIGEFGVVRWAGASGDMYIRDLIDIFNKYGWSWAFHTYRSAPDWDAELVEEGQSSKLFRSEKSNKMTIILNGINEK